MSYIFTSIKKKKEINFSLAAKRHEYEWDGWLNFLYDLE